MLLWTYALNLVSRRFALLLANQNLCGDPQFMGARQFYWKLRHLERALLKNMHVDKRLASTAFIVDIWGKGMIIDWVWLERLLPIRTFTLYFNTNQCENVPSDWRKTPAFDSQRRLLSSCIMFFCNIALSNASLWPHRRKQVTRPSLANEGPTLGAPKNFPRKKRPCPSPLNTNHVFRRYFRWLCVNIRVWIGPRWSKRLDRSGSPAFWYGSGGWIGLWVQGLNRAFTFWLMLLVGQQDHETAFHPHWQTSRTYVFVCAGSISRLSRGFHGQMWGFHGNFTDFHFGRVHGHFRISRSFGSIAKVPVHFIASDAKKVCNEHLQRAATCHWQHSNG